MSQHINLLPRAPKPPAISALRSLTALGLLLLGLACIAQWQHWQGIKTQQAMLAAERHLHAQQAILSALKKKLGERDAPTSLDAQIAALEPQTRVSKDLLARLKSGELGSLNGYAAQLTALARITQPGVWLTSIAISNAGRSLRIEGRALQNDKVLQYAGKLNDAMQRYDAAVSSLEIMPLSASPEDKPAATVFAFKLY